MAPSSPPVELSLSCPGNIRAQATSRDGVAVLYPAPNVVGGVPPVSIICTPNSGGVFAAGISTVTCTVTDAQRLSKSCGFSIIIDPVPPAPTLRATRILAFGDSITEGIDGDTHLAPAPYPSRLRLMLADRYRNQDIEIINAGVGGERVVNDGFRRFQSLLAMRADVILLMEGTNDLSSGDPGTVTPTADTLRLMIRMGRSTGATVFIGTCLPTRRVYNGLIDEMNRSIRTSAGIEGATLVDLNIGFGGPPYPLLGIDGLHPTQAGYQRIAELFFIAIKDELETSLSANANPQLRCVAGARRHVGSRGSDKDSSVNPH